MPIYGTWQISILLILGAILGELIFYKVFGSLPRGRKLSDQKEVALIKVFMAVILTGLFAASWDVWWHRAVGRDTLFEPPHILLYSAATVAILIGLYIWRHTNEKIWRYIAMAVLLVPLSAPFDNLWHIFFGVEDLSRPVSLSWSPPHAMLDLAVLITFVLTLKALHRHHKVKDEGFFGGVGFAAIFITAMFLVMPFHPTEGWGQVAGFAGAGVLSAVYVTVALSAQNWIKSSVSAIWMTLFALMLMLTSYGKETGPGIILMPHDRQPIWIYTFAYLTAAGFLDLTKKKLPVWIRGGFAGGIWALILFGLSSKFLSPEFQYPFSDALVATISGAIGGIAASWFYEYFNNK